MIPPLSTAGVLEQTVSMATGSCRRSALHAGNGDLMAFRMLGPDETLFPNCVVFSSVFSMTSFDLYRKHGFNKSYFSLLNFRSVTAMVNSRDPFIGCLLYTSDAADD